MRVNVRLFARLRDIAGSGELIRDVEAPATVQTIWRSLVAEFPALGEYERSMSVAVNTDYSRMTAAVHDGDEVAFLPPVSGGDGPAKAGPYVHVVGAA
jgi:molybdopterin converting factor subunit 1